jgi:hypothetical protein
MSGRWRDRITGGGDEFSDRGRELSPEQREHLTRVTDELLKRYSISRSVGPGEAPHSPGGELVTADEIGAVLESVLAEAFDFGWFTRSDLPEAPELTMEPEDADWEPGPVGGRESRPVLEPVEWTDPGAEDEDVVLDWGLGLGGARAMDPQPDSELIPELEVEEAEPVVEEAEPVVEEAEPVVEEAEPVVEVAEPVVEVAEPVVEVAPEPALEPVLVDAGVLEEPTAELAVDVEQVALVAVEVAELEEIHRGAVQAEREAIMFAAATRQRLAEAREALAALQAGA